VKSRITAKKYIEKSKAEKESELGFLQEKKTIHSKKLSSDFISSSSDPTTHKIMYVLCPVIIM